VTEVEDSSVPIGQVISQDPPALTPAKQSTPVNLTVSQGAGKFTIPRVVGAPGDTAKSILEGDPGHLVVTIASEANDTVPVGFVIRTEPGADTVVDKGSPITIVISTGPTQVEVPLLTGLLEGNARDLLAEKGLIADPVTFEDLPFGNVNVGRVVSQSVAVGQHVNSSSSIGLVIGRALPEVTTTTAAPTTTAAVTTTTAAPATTTTAAATTTTASTPPTGP
jgi:eukaryotic-like serine/threonine-protein kinase